MGRLRVIYWYVCKNSHFSRIYSRHDTVAIALWECVRKWYNLYPPSDTNTVLTLWYPKSSEPKSCCFFFGKRQPPGHFRSSCLASELPRERSSDCNTDVSSQIFRCPFVLKIYILIKCSSCPRVPGRCAGLSGEGRRNHLAMSKD